MKNKAEKLIEEILSIQRGASNLALKGQATEEDWYDIKDSEKKIEHIRDELLSLIPGEVEIDKKNVNRRRTSEGYHYYCCPNCEQRNVTVDFKACPYCQSTIIWKDEE